MQKIPENLLSYYKKAIDSDIREFDIEVSGFNNEDIISLQFDQDLGSDNWVIGQCPYAKCTINCNKNVSMYRGQVVLVTILVMYYDYNNEKQWIRVPVGRYTIHEVSSSSTSKNATCYDDLYFFTEEKMSSGTTYPTTLGVAIDELFSDSVDKSDFDPYRNYVLRRPIEYKDPDEVDEEQPEDEMIPDDDYDVEEDFPEDEGDFGDLIEEDEDNDYENDDETPEDVYDDNEDTGDYDDDKDGCGCDCDCCTGDGDDDDDSGDDDSGEDSDDPNAYKYRFATDKEWSDFAKKSLPKITYFDSIEFNTDSSPSGIKIDEYILDYDASSVQTPKFVSVSGTGSTEEMIVNPYGGGHNCHLKYSCETFFAEYFKVTVLDYFIMPGYEGDNIVDEILNGIKESRTYYVWGDLCSGGGNYDTTITSTNYKDKYSDLAKYSPSETVIYNYQKYNKSKFRTDRDLLNMSYGYSNRLYCSLDIGTSYTFKIPKYMKDTFTNDAIDFSNRFFKFFSLSPKHAISSFEINDNGDHEVLNLQGLGIRVKYEFFSNSGRTLTADEEKFYHYYLSLQEGFYSLDMNQEEWMDPCGYTIGYEHLHGNITFITDEGTCWHRPDCKHNKYFGSVSLEDLTYVPDNEPPEEYVEASSYSIDGVTYNIENTISEIEPIETIEEPVSQVQVEESAAQPMSMLARMVTGETEEKEKVLDTSTKYLGDGMTKAELLGHIAALCGGNIVLDGSGNPRLIRLKTSYDKYISAHDYSEPNVENADSLFSISGIECTVSSDEKDSVTSYGSGGGPMLKLENPFMTQEYLDHAVTFVSNSAFNYYNISTTVKGDPRLMLGDVVALEGITIDPDVNALDRYRPSGEIEHQFPIMRLTGKYDTGYGLTIEANTSVESESDVYSMRRDVAPVGYIEHKKGFLSDTVEFLYAEQFKANEQIADIKMAVRQLNAYVAYINKLFAIEVQSDNVITGTIYADKVKMKTADNRSIYMDGDSLSFIDADGKSKLYLGYDPVKESYVMNSANSVQGIGNDISYLLKYIKELEKRIKRLEGGK